MQRFGARHVSDIFRFGIQQVRLTGSRVSYKRVTQVVVDGALRSCAVRKGRVVERKWRRVASSRSLLLFNFFSYQRLPCERVCRFSAYLYVETLQQEVT